MKLQTENTKISLSSRGFTLCLEGEEEFSTPSLDTYSKAIHTRAGTMAGNERSQEP